MDEVARSFFELNFQVAFMARKGSEFQDFFAAIMEKRYPGDFVRVRPWGNIGDRKCDGYLESKRILFQCYAPNELSSLQCVAKIDKDFRGALPHWREHFDFWVFVHNDRSGLNADVLKKLLDLSTQHAPLKALPWGFEELRQETMMLDAAHLSSLFGVAPSRQGMIEVGLDDLAPILDHIARLAPVPDPDIRPVPADKLQRNLLSDNVGTLLRAGMSRADLVRKYFKLKPTLQDQIAESFRFRYGNLRSRNESPDDIFASLQRFAAGERLPSPSTQSAVLAILAFFFEECDIFERFDMEEE